MRASTLFALTIAVLLGLGVAVAARMSGLFSKPPEPTTAKKQEIQILVAAKNLFAGDTIDPAAVRVRTLRPEEIEHYQQYRDDYLPPSANAAFLRIAKTDILAEQPILKQNLEDMAKPSPLNTRLVHSMRAVNVSLPRDEAAGGLIQVGEWVDVFLTSTIRDAKGKSTTRTAVIAPHVRVIAKRNTLWPLFAPLPQDKPVQFTLEVNPYRAALIEYAKNKGQLMLTPLPTSEQKRLEESRAAVLKGDNPDAVVFVKDGDEARDEQIRVAAYGRGELVVDERDLVRVFGLTTAEPAAPAASTIAVEQIAGVNHYQPARFADGSRVYPTKNSPAASPPAPQGQSPALATSGLQFTLPDAGTMPNCVNCAKKKQGR